MERTTRSKMICRGEMGGGMMFIITFSPRYSRMFSESAAQRVFGIAIGFLSLLSFSV